MAGVGRPHKMTAANEIIFEWEYISINIIVRKFLCTRVKQIFSSCAILQTTIPGTCTTSVPKYKYRVHVPGSIRATSYERNLNL